MDFELGLPTGTMGLSLAMGTWTAGGGPNDALSLPGFPAGLFTVRVGGDRATLESSVALNFGSLPLPAHVERLWLPGEVVTLSRGVCLRRSPPPRRTPGQASARTGDTDTWPTRHPTLVCVIGDGLGRTWCLSQREVQLGRARNAQVRLKAPTVSRVHAALVHHASHWLLVPHHSKNPTRVNGAPVRGAKELTDGDVIEVGAVALRFFKPPTEPTESVTRRMPDAEPLTHCDRTAVVSRPMRARWQVRLARFFATLGAVF